MPEVRLKALEIVEIDHRDVVGGVRHSRFVAGAVHHTRSDADVSNRGNLTNRSLERGDQRLALGGCQVRTGFHQHDVSNHEGPSSLIVSWSLVFSSAGRASEQVRPGAKDQGLTNALEDADPAAKAIVHKADVFVHNEAREPKPVDRWNERSD